MNIEEYKSIDEAFDKAQEDTTPFAVVSGDEVFVAGDANKTEINTHDYTMKFRVPTREDGKVVYKHLTKEFKDVYITPRMDVKVNRMMVQLMPYFKKVDGNEVGKYTLDEAKEIVNEFSDEIMDIMYDTVACVLSIPKDLKEYMLPTSVMEAVAKIIREYPETVNEADTFFD